jgi:hypothetical protein
MFTPRDESKKYCSLKCYWASGPIGLIYGPKSQFLPLEERFWKFVYKTNGCWFWIGATNWGYGVIYDGEKNAMHAHRISWILHFGPIPESKLHVCHTCDIRQCVRPDHLFLGTVAENLKDARDKGRAHPPQTYGANRWK